MIDKTATSHLPEIVIAVWVLAPKLLPYWKAWLKSRAKATADSPAPPTAHTSQPQPQPRIESWGWLAADGVLLVLVLWRLAALSFSEAPATEGVVARCAGLGAAMVICSMRKA
jgi:hypothetical protein